MAAGWRRSQAQRVCDGLVNSPEDRRARWGALDGDGGAAVRSNWGFLILGIYLILAGLRDFGLLPFFSQFTGIVGLVAGILILTEQGRR